jgi:hypothetical protein
LTPVPPGTVVFSAQPITVKGLLSTLPFVGPFNSRLLGPYTMYKPQLAAQVCVPTVVHRECRAGAARRRRPVLRDARDRRRPDAPSERIGERFGRLRVYRECARDPEGAYEVEHAVQPHATGAAGMRDGGRLLKDQASATGSYAYVANAPRVKYSTPSTKAPKPVPGAGTGAFAVHVFVDGSYASTVDTLPTAFRPPTAYQDAVADVDDRAGPGGRQRRSRGP